MLVVHFVYVAAFSLLFASLAAPLICELIIFYQNSLPWPFSRVFNRTILVGLIIAFFLARKHFNFSEGKTAIKYQGKISSRYFLVGLVLSLISSLIFLPILFYNNVIDYKLATDLLYRIVKTFATASIVAVLEEFVFRGVLFTNFKKITNTFFAAIITSLIFAAVHFIAPVKQFEFESGQFFQGFNYISLVFSNLFNPNLLPAFLGLFLVGLTLNLAFIKTKSLYLSIGLHFGWIFVQKFVGYLTVINPEFKPEIEVLKRVFLVSHPVSWLAIASVLVLIYFSFKTPDDRKAS